VTERVGKIDEDWRRYAIWESWSIETRKVLAPDFSKPMEDRRLSSTRSSSGKARRASAPEISRRCSKRSSANKDLRGNL